MNLFAGFVAAPGRFLVLIPHCRCSLCSQSQLHSFHTRIDGKGGEVAPLEEEQRDASALQSNHTISQLLQLPKESPRCTSLWSKYW
ncbi:uncharacterized protein LOC111009928 isoform X3 [Momordica charantia]|uniref:Uncharacterized protein LOC111009928 isoform X3 n=1 Tax=Momordica charantia TaxID=3673 RepID=A0A6J1CEB3_MOMCH|nr:uncharacterized protein LOC111009928 isoform X3 [Momordica charantia]